ncbi:hypothetical protein A7A08_01803 [Methyloligella halotolerans]|uniref:Uncharacterized protein n=1 Tax=Methyloligella halotolerans TaxID=1177755 RepID=A0A1E2RYD5_9HYPH|nr:hypothetical protein [Methyloligella halotolerans]ODA67059.1 hypothetical protein A7A08_01803 [Methyloligella halotolerans]
MRAVAFVLTVLALCAYTLLLTGPAKAAPSGRFSSAEQLIDWASNYRSHPSPHRLPAAVHAMHELGLFGDEEKGGFCIGFIAGVLGTNKADAPKLIAGMFPMPPKEQAVIIKAIAYSGRPDWQDLLIRFQDQMPYRKPLIDAYVDGKEPGLMEIPLEEGSPVIYTLWGYYSATGQYQPVMRIIEALRWSKSDEEAGFSWSSLWSGWKTDPKLVDKVTTGATAKWTLASYAERDRQLLSLYRAEYPNQPEEIAIPLREVILAAESFEAEEVRKDQLSAIEEAQHEHAMNQAGGSKLAKVGSIGIATGCVAASALGQAQIAVPCVVGGALYNGAVQLLQ